jgi:hypothetical protein
MNKKLQELARKTLKEGLSKCTDEQKLVFARMYYPNNIDLDYEVVVDNMPADKLDWAMSQVQRTLDKNEKR